MDFELHRLSHGPGDAAVSRPTTRRVVVVQTGRDSRARSGACSVYESDSAGALADRRESQTIGKRLVAVPSAPARTRVHAKPQRSRRATEPGLPTTRCVSRLAICETHFAKESLPCFGGATGLSRLPVVPRASVSAMLDLTFPSRRDRNEPLAGIEQRAKKGACAQSRMLSGNSQEPVCSSGPSRAVSCAPGRRDLSRLGDPADPRAFASYAACRIVRPHPGIWGCTAALGSAA